MVETKDQLILSPRCAPGARRKAVNRSSNEERKEIMSSRNLWIAAAALAVVTSGAFAGEHVVTQKDKHFNVRQLKVKVGDTVKFRNDDPFFHNIFSLSKTRSFDLGSYPKGEARSVTFDKPGTVEVECAIHPSMKMTVEVTK